MLHMKRLNINPFPNKSWFLPVCSTSLFENTVGKGEIARNEQFLLFPLCFLPFWRTYCQFHEIVVCKLLDWTSLNLSFWKGLIKHVFLGLTRFLSLSPLQRCMVRVTNDNSAWRLVFRKEIRPPPPPPKHTHCCYYEGFRRR